MTLDTDKDYDAELWETVEDDALLPDAFVPGIIDLRRPLEPIMGKAWRANPPARLPVHALPRARPEGDLPMEGGRAAGAASTAARADRGLDDGLPGGGLLPLQRNT